MKILIKAGRRIKCSLRNASDSLGGALSSLRDALKLMKALFTFDFQYLDHYHPEYFIKQMRRLFWLMGVILRLRMRLFPRRAVLYVGHLYYYPWYLSRGLRRLGWQADVLNWDANPDSQIYYHGED